LTAGAGRRSAAFTTGAGAGVTCCGLSLFFTSLRTFVSLIVNNSCALFRVGLPPDERAVARS